MCLLAYSTTVEKRLHLFNLGAGISFMVAQFILEAYAGAAMSFILGFSVLVYKNPDKPWIKWGLFLILMVLSAHTFVIQNSLLVWALATGAGVFMMAGFNFFTGTKQRICLVISTGFWTALSLETGLYSQTLSCLISFVALFVGHLRNNPEKVVSA